MARFSSESLTVSSLRRRKFAEGKLEHLRGLVNGDTRVDAEGTGIAEGSDLGVDGVGQSAIFTDGLEETGAHAAAEHAVEQVDGVPIGVVNGGRGHPEAELHLLERLFPTEE